MASGPRYSATLFDPEPPPARPRKTAGELARRLDRDHPFDLPPEPYPLWVGTSGGRTSGYQLWRYIDRLGLDVVNGPRVAVGFCNTGEETEAAMAFVRDQERHWGVRVVWLEFRFEWFPDSLRLDPGFVALRRRQYADRADRGLRAEVAAAIEAAGFPDQADDIRQGRETTNGRDAYAVVGYETASRDREPFAALLESREEYRRAVKGLPGVLPNSANNGMCTGKLKVDVARRYMRDRFGVGPHGYAVALALRAGDRDEERQGAIQGRETDGGVPVFPLIEAGVDAAEVGRFWAGQPFRLDQPGYEGNCRECHQKPASVLHYLLHKRPDRAAWRVGWEERTGDRFDRGMGPYKRLLQQLPLVGDPPDDGGSVVRCHSGYCGD